MGEEEEIDEEADDVDTREFEDSSSEEEEETPGPNRIGGTNFPTLELTLQEA